eukprot:15458349-Alexandrium_andersonii.AAC.1
MPYYGRERSDRATLGAASRHPKLPRKRIFAHSTAPVGRRPREGSEGPLWRVLASLRGDPAIGRRPVLRLSPNCYDLADFLAKASCRHCDSGQEV